MILTVFFDPQGTVRIEHDLDHVRVFQRVYKERAAGVAQAFQQARIVTGAHEHQRSPPSTNTATLSSADTATMAASQVVLFLKDWSLAA